jgi:hypothetical protein
MSETKPDPTLAEIATKCLARIEALGLKGKAADDAALHFFAGAAAALQTTAHHRKQSLSNATNTIAERGMFHVRELVVRAKGLGI